MTAIILIAVACVLIAVTLFTKRALIPFIKRIKEGHEYRERMKEGISGKKSLHPEVAECMKEMNALKDSKMKSKYSTQYGNGNLDAEGEIPGVFDGPADVPIADIQTAESLERELVDPSADSVTQTAYLATQANQPTRFASSFTGPEATKTPATKVGGKWNHARSRLANLEAQLDALLDELPDQYLPTPPDSAAEESAKSVNNVVPFYQDDAGEIHLAPRDGESEGAIDRVSSVAKSRTGRSSGVLKIKVPRTEKPKYKRPSIPDPLTGMEQLSRSSRNPVTPDGESTRPSVAGIRRAPDLISIFDENYSPAAVAASAPTQEPSTPKLSSDATAPDDLTSIDVANKTIEVKGIVASVKPSPKRVRDAWKVNP